MALDWRWNIGTICEFVAARFDVQQLASSVVLGVLNTQMYWRTCKYWSSTRENILARQIQSKSIYFN